MRNSLENRIWDLLFHTNEFFWKELNRGVNRNIIISKDHSHLEKRVFLYGRRISKSAPRSLDTKFTREVDNFAEKLIKNFNISIPCVQEFEDKFVEEFEGRKLLYL